MYSFDDKTNAFSGITFEHSNSLDGRAKDFNIKTFIIITIDSHIAINFLGSMTKFQYYQ